MRGRDRRWRSGWYRNMRGMRGRGGGMLRLILGCESESDFILLDEILSEGVPDAD